MALAEVEVAEGLRVGDVVRRVARPHVVTQKRAVLAGAHLDGAQAALHLLVAGLVEEVVLEHALVLVEALLLHNVLRLSEVHVGVDLHGFVHGQAAEGIVAADFVLVGQLKRALWNDVAVVLNCVNGELETVQLS